jgi:hypothetical protein
MKITLVAIVAPLALGLTACGSTAYLHGQPGNALIVRTTPPPPRTSDYFVVTHGAAHVDVTYPAGSVHYAPNLADRTSD